MFCLTGKSLLVKAVETFMLKLQLLFSFFFFVNYLLLFPLLVLFPIFDTYEIYINVTEQKKQGGNKITMGTLHLVSDNSCHHADTGKNT